jgi:hypothetical protein
VLAVFGLAGGFIGGFILSGTPNNNFAH